MRWYEIETVLLGRPHEGREVVVVDPVPVGFHLEQRLLGLLLLPSCNMIIDDLSRVRAHDSI
jgi:hypothetical protein